ncbi:MAG TPA: 50S ribosomal protein L4 [candidate division Zixibacteria bacterium]|nr:50S ribosomal protein L4 [candidate division Zixibacteria bacterium]
MAKAKKISNTGGSAGEVELNPEVFEFEPKNYQVHQYIKSFLRNNRQGTHSTKNRREVRGGGAKPWRQKGTGRARAGSNTSPVWVGGGRAFGPKPKNYNRAIPKAIKRQALYSALADKASDEKIMVIEDLKLEKPRTKSVVEFLAGLDLYGRKVLILNEGENRNFEMSCRNIPGVSYMRARLINAYHLLNSEYLLMTESALNEIEEVFAK